jgi:hypothetical protein
MASVSADTTALLLQLRPCRATSTLLRFLLHLDINLVLSYMILSLSYCYSFSYIRYTGLQHAATKSQMIRGPPLVCLTLISLKHFGEFPLSPLSHSRIINTKLFSAEVPRLRSRSRAQSNHILSMIQIGEKRKVNGECSQLKDC